MSKAIPILASAAAGYVSGGLASYATGAFITSTATTSLLAAKVVYGATYLTSSLAMSVATSALTSSRAKASKSGGAIAPQYPYVDNGVKINGRNTVEFQDRVYGETRKGGTLVFERTTSSGVNNKNQTKTGRDSYLHQIVAFAAHEIEEFVEFYLDDDLLSIDADGWVTNARYTKNSDTEAAKGAIFYFSAPYATTATGSGTSASVYIEEDFATAGNFMGAGDLIQVTGISDPAYNGFFVITSIATHAAGAGTRVNYTTDTTITDTAPAQTSMTFSIGAIGFRGQTAYCYNNTGHGLIVGDNVYISDASPDLYNKDSTLVLSTPTTRTFTYAVSEAPTEGSITGNFQRRNGTDEALVFIKAFTGAAGQNLGLDTDINAKLPDTLTATDKFEGMALVYARYYDASEFTTSPTLTVKIKGAKIYDPRNPGVLAYSNNAVLCMMDYLHRKTGANEDVPIGVGVDYDAVNNTSEDLDLDFICDQADIADESVELLDGSFQPRYTINGTVSLGEQPIDILSLLNPCTQGAVTYFDWNIKIHCAAYTPASIDIDETWFNGSMKIEVSGDKQSLVNTVKTLFNDEAQNYYSDDMPKYTEAIFLDEDNGEELTDDLQMPFITNVERAQRLGKLYLQQNRANRKKFSIPLNTKGCVIAPFDTVRLTYPRYNYYRKVFKVIGHTEGLLNEGVTVILREESPELYDWDASEATT